MSSESFPALTGFYRLLFLYIEPISTVSPAFLAWFFPGAAWFHSELIPTPGGTSGYIPAIDDRTRMAIWQLGNCYLLLGLISSFVLRAARSNFQHDPATQEKVVRALLTPLAIADVTHVVLSIIGLPVDIRASPVSWNPMTHGNITFTTLLFLVRSAWLLGVGRKTHVIKSKTN